MDPKTVSLSLMFINTKPNFWLGAYCRDGDEDFPQYQTLHLMKRKIYF